MGERKVCREGGIALMSPRMKRDCPHCRESMAGEFLHWRKFAKQDHSRACPICGKEIRLATHPEETAVRVITVVVLVGSAYLMKHRGGGYLAILATAAAIIAISFGLAHLRLRDAQRFRKAEGA